MLTPPPLSLTSAMPPTLLTPPHLGDAPQDADPDPRTSAMPPTMTATEPFLSKRLRLARVAGTAPIQAMKWRQPLYEGGRD